MLHTSHIYREGAGEEEGLEGRHRAPRLRAIQLMGERLLPSNGGVRACTCGRDWGTNRAVLGNAVIVSVLVMVVVMHLWGDLHGQGPISHLVWHNAARLYHGDVGQCRLALAIRVQALLLLLYGR